MATTFPASPPLAALLRRAQARAWSRTRRVLLAALGLSVAVHLAFTLWPADTSSPPESMPLAVTITELPPPPKPVVVAQPQPAPKPRPRRARPHVAAPRPVETAPAAPTVEADAPEPAPASAPATEAAASPAPAPAATSESAAEVVPGAVPDARTLPPRIDLAYKVFWGARGFLIGDAVYRFEHRGQRYRIRTIGEARGLAALVLRGQGKIESRGLITPEGLQPLEMRVERGGSDRVETAQFDWEAGIVTLRDNKTAPLELPTFDPLALMWQYYFTPPTADQVTVTVATPRRLAKYTITREGTDTIEWGNGPIEAERWHRRSEDGRTDAYVWLAPSLRYVPVKILVSNTSRGTIEVLLDSIRVDEDAAAVGRDDLVMPKVDPADYGPAPDSPLAPPTPGETFPRMTH